MRTGGKLYDYNKEKLIYYITIIFYFRLTIRVFETIDGHCGYEFSWSPYRLLPMSGSAEYHNFHHSHNSGGFASFFTYWDTICGTNKDYFIHKSKKEKVDFNIIFTTRIWEFG